MASNFPTGLDNFATTRSDSTAMATTHAADHNNYADAINKIEAELGISPSGSDSTVAARLIRINESPVNVMDPTYGAVGNASTDDGAAFQAALSAAGSTGNPERIIVPPAEYRIRRELLVPPWQRRLRMEGIGGVRIRWDTDLGAGKFAIRHSISGDTGVPLGNAKGFELANMELWGPSIADPVYGDYLSNMAGVLVDSGCLFENINIGGFGNCFWLVGNHNAWYNCGIGGSYGIYVGPDIAGYTFTQGDLTFVNVNFERNLIAGIRVHPDQSFVSGKFFRCHFFSVPIGILKEGPSGSDTSVCNSCTFVGTYWESFGNAMIYSAAANGVMSDCTFIDSGANNKYAPATIAAHPDDAMLDVPNISGVRVIGGTGWDEPGDLSLFRASSSVHDFYIDNMATGMQNARVAGKRFMTGAQSNTERNVVVRWGDGYTTPFNTYCQARLYKAAAAVVIGDVAELSGDQHTVNKFNAGSTGICAGIVAETSATSDRLLVVEEGRFLARVDAAITVNANTWVKPDPSHNGCVMPATGRYDTNVIGFSTAGTSTDAVVGRSVPVQLIAIARGSGV